MLPRRNHGASTLGTSLRRPIFNKLTMASYNGTSALAADAMRSSLSKAFGGRAKYGFQATSEG
jgi:hypothetical protein